MQKVIKLYFNESLSHVYEKHKSFFRFITVGCINTGVDFISFTILHGLFGVDKFFSQIAGYSLGIINSFILNKLWTFENRDSRFSTANQIIKFIAINIVSLGISLLGLKLLSESCGMNVYVSKVIITAIAQAVNYTGYKSWVFSNPKRL